MRRLVQLSVAGWAAGELTSSRVAAAQKPSGHARYRVQITLGGGVDSIYTTDPRRRKSVAPWIDVPYGPNRIITSGDLEAGPHFESLREWLPRMAFLNGVAIGTVGHPIGHEKIARLKLRSDKRMPTLLDILAEAKGDQPLGVVKLGTASGGAGRTVMASDKLGVGAGLIAEPDPAQSGLFDELESLPEEELRSMSAVLQSKRRRLEGLKIGSSGERSRTVRSLSEAADFLSRLPGVPKFRLQSWSEVPIRQTFARALQRTLWLLENDLAAGIHCGLGFSEWDSHYSNDARQTVWNANFASQFHLFLKELSSRRNAHGLLIDNTDIWISSEIGRHARLNEVRGKDHFPEIPIILMGPSFACGPRGKRYGATGRELESLPIDLASGLPAKGGIKPTVEDLGTSILAMAGLNPGLYGYWGRRLRFLEAA